MKELVPVIKTNLCRATRILGNAYAKMDGLVLDVRAETNQTATKTRTVMGLVVSVSTGFLPNLPTVQVHVKLY